jgi:ABC-2 type transport system ATP-binding protein
LSAELRVEALALRRGGRPILDGVSFDVAAGEIVALIGANGAGKTTLLETIAGFQRPNAGRILFAGEPLGDLASRARVLSFMSDRAEPAPEVSVAAHLAHAVRYGRPPAGEAEALTETLGLTPLLGARAGELSRGERRRIALFAALATERPAIVLDEPLGTFDPLQLLEVLQVLRHIAAAKKAILLSVHQMSDAEKIASRILLLDAGRVVAFGALDELRSRAGRPNASLEEVFVALLSAARGAAA